jgi:SAM-dependent methyltransferase
MNWRIKGIIQKTLSVTPGGSAINNRLQLKLGGLRNFERSVDSKVCDDWFVFLDHLRKIQFPIEGHRFLEIGTGWYPTLPTCFAIAGAQSCLTFDVKRLLDWNLTRRMLRRLEVHLPEMASRAGGSEPVFRDRWTRLMTARDFGEFCELSGIDYRSPGDAAATGLDSCSVDVVFSNSVLEHVPRPVIVDLMRETRRVLRHGGIAMHSVNCGDHYAYFDRSITQIHYLRYGERHFTLWNNSLQYQNRMRPNEFIQIAEDCDLQIRLNLQRPRPELLAHIGETPIARAFRHWPPEQLCTTSVDFVAQPRSSAAGNSTASSVETAPPL